MAMSAAEVYLERIWNILKGGADNSQANPYDPIGAFAVNAEFAAVNTADYIASFSTARLYSNGAKGLMLFLDIFAVPGGGETLTIFIDAYNPATQDWTATFQTVALATTGLRKYIIHAPVVDTQSQFTSVAQTPIPASFRVRCLQSVEASTWNYGVGISLMP